MKGKKKINGQFKASAQVWSLLHAASRNKGYTVTTGLL